MPVGCEAATSVAGSSFREDPEILERCPASWLAENPTEVIVVPDVDGRLTWLMLASACKTVWRLPLVALLTIVIALPVKAYAFLTINQCQLG
jgi:hypothetical protein